MSLLEMIQDVSMFEYFTEEEKQKFCARDHILVVFQKGDIIIEEGENTDSIFLLLEGKALITKKMNDANIRLAKLEPGQVFGEMSFFSGAPRRTRVMANSEVKAIHIDKDFFATLDFSIRDKIKDYLIELLIERLDSMNEQIMRISQSLRF